MARSSSGPGRRPLKAEITGSTPVRATNVYSSINAEVMGSPEGIPTEDPRMQYYFVESLDVEKLRWARELIIPFFIVNMKVFYATIRKTYFHL